MAASDPVLRGPLGEAVAMITMWTVPPHPDGSRSVTSSPRLRECNVLLMHLLHRWQLAKSRSHQLPVLVRIHRDADNEVSSNKRRKGESSTAAAAAPPVNDRKAQGSFSGDGGRTQPLPQDGGADDNGDLRSLLVSRSKRFAPLETINPPSSTAASGEDGGGGGGSTHKSKSSKSKSGR